MTPEQREEMVDGLYYLATASNGRNLRDLVKTRNLSATVKAMKNMDPETKEIMEQTLGILMRSAKDSLFFMLEKAMQAKPSTTLRRLGSRIRREPNDG